MGRTVWLRGALGVVLALAAAGCAPTSSPASPEVVTPAPAAGGAASSDFTRAGIPTPAVAGVELATPAGKVAPEPAAIAPDFSLTSLDGRVVSLSALRGRAVLLNFFATWCVPCKKELPAFQQAYEQRKSEGLEVVLVDVLESPEQVTPFLRDLGVSLTAVIDADGKVSSGAYKVRALPSSFFIDRAGVIRFIQFGEIGPAALEQRLDQILAS